MTTITKYPYALDGQDLSNWAFAVEARAGLLGMSERIGENVQVARRAGRIWTPDKVDDQATLVLAMWIRGTDANNSTPVVSGVPEQDWAIQLHKNLDAIQRLLRKKYLPAGYPAPLKLTQTRRDGTSREIFCECTTAVPVELVQGGRPIYRINAEMICPEAYWRDATLVLNGSAVAAAAGATAPMEDLIYSLAGPGSGTANNPRITDPNSGVWVQYNGNLATGAVWTIDAGAWTSVIGAANVITSTVHNGSPRLMTLTPPADGSNPALTVTYTGGNAPGALTLTGRRKYFS